MHRTLFTIGPVAVHSYGVLLMLGFIAGIVLSRREARRLDLSPEVPLDLGVWILIAGVLGARSLYVVLNWRFFATNPFEAIRIWHEGGLSFYGGLLGGVAAALAFTWRRRLQFWTVADMLAPGLAIGYGIARFGCLLNGCCYGGPTHLAWGMRFPLWPDSAVLTEPSHPTQIYSAIGSFAILGVLMAVRGRIQVSGRLFLLYLMLYAVLRSAIEVLRKGYTAEVLVDGLTEAQTASAVIFIGALVVFVLRRRRVVAGTPSAER